MKIIINILFIFFSLFNGITFAQSKFSIPDDSICVDVLFSPINQSQNAIDYLWHFNSANMYYPPTGNSLGNTGFLNMPAFITMAQDSGNYYTFSSNLNAKNIIRNRFSTSLSNTPDSANLGNIGGLLPNSLEGIQVVKNNNTWFGFVVGGKSSSSSLIRFSFGSSLDSIPKNAINLGNYNMDFPQDLTIINDNGTWMGFTISFSGNSLTRFNFNAGLNNPPTATNFTFNGNLINPWGLSRPFKDNNKWYLFVTCMNSNTLKRIDFSSSLLNTPTLNELSNSGILTSPRTVRIVHDCEKTYGLVANHYHHTLTRLEFPNGVENQINYSALGNLGALNQPQGMTEITRSDNDIFVIIANINNNTLSRIQYQPFSTPPVSSDANPTISYPNPGNYNINLIAWQSLVTKDCYCKNITVLDKPHVTLGNDTTICPYDKLLLDPIDSFLSYRWNNNTNKKTIVADTAGAYWLEVTNNIGCADRDTIILTHFADNLFLGNDTSFTLGQSIVLNAGEQYTNCLWSTGELNPSIEIKKPGIYAVLVKDMVPGTINSPKYCTYMDTIVVNLTMDVPNFFTPNSDGVNDTWSPNLLYHYPEADIFIYDRFGKRVAHFKGDGMGWDGTFNNRIVDTDTYWYVIDLRDGSRPIRGPVTVKTK